MGLFITFLMYISYLETKKTIPSLPPSCNVFSRVFVVIFLLSLKQNLPLPFRKMFR